MAYIQSCEVIGLANQFNRSIRFNREINVIFGGNGSGKTSLLKVLHSALANDLTEIKRISLTSATVVIEDAQLEEDQPWFPATSVTRTTPQSYPHPGEKLEQAFGSLSRRTNQQKQWESVASRDGQDTVFKHIFLPISRVYENKTARAETLMSFASLGSETDHDKTFAENLNLLWLRYTRNIGIEVQLEQAQGLRQILYDFLVPAEILGSEVNPGPIADPHTAYERLLSFLDRQSKFDRDLLNESSFATRMQDEPRMRKVVQDAELVEERVDAIRRPRTELEKILRTMIGGGKKIRLQDRDIKAIGRSEEDISLEDLSSGEKQLLRIFIDVLLADGEPIIIDEPELSLHIDWQRKLLRILQRLAPNSQIIVATHSPEIMAEISEENIIELK